MRRKTYTIGYSDPEGFFHSFETLLTEEEANKLDTWLRKLKEEEAVFEPYVLPFTSYDYTLEQAKAEVQETLGLSDSFIASLE